MSTRQRNQWVVDAVLFAGFIAAFFLNVTGLDLHEWIGVGVAALAVYHLAAHWKWIGAVSGRLFSRSAGRPKLYYGIDAALLVGMLTIAGTGLAISSWLNLSLPGFAAWRVVHITASVLTLLVLVVKIGLHGRWIASTAKAFFRRPAAAGAWGTAVPVAGRGRPVSRREFLGMMGVAGAVSALALANAWKGLLPVTAQAAAQTGSQAAASPAAAAALTGANAVQVSAAPTATAATAAASQASASSCTYRCPRNNHCSFPGRCGRYTDTNGNGRCDLGECA